MKTTILCPVTQRIPAHKAHDKLIVRTAAALADAGAHVVLLAPAPLPSADELLDLYGAPRTANLELVPIPATPRFLYRGRLLKRASMIQAAAIYTSEFKVGAAFARKKRKLSAPLFYEAHALMAEVARATTRERRFFDAREQELFSAVDGLLVTVGTLAERIRAA